MTGLRIEMSVPFYLLLGLLINTNWFSPDGRRLCPLWAEAATSQLDPGQSFMMFLS